MATTWLLARHLALGAPLLGTSWSAAPLPVCVFVHGAGVRVAIAPAAADLDYWGNLHDRLQDKCATQLFMHEDTLHVGWEDARLQRRVCSLVERGARVASKASVPLIIFAHSLGNALLAGALQAGLCALPANAAWYSAAAPWHGSRAADRLPDICAGSGMVNSALRSLAQRLHYCEGEDGGPSAGFASLNTSNAALRVVADAWQGRVNGSLCGDSAFGLWSFDSTGMQALADLANFGAANDGAVPTDACHPRGVQPERTHESRHFTAGANHYDLACRHGDGSLPWGGDDRRPCSWYEAMVARTRASLP